MILKAAAAAILIALPSAGTALSAPPAAAPPMSTGNTFGRAPKTPTVAPSATEMRASKAIGAGVYDAAGKPVATVADLVVDRRSGRVVLAILQASGGLTFAHDRVAVAWNSLRFLARPTPHFVTRLSPGALTNGAGFEQKAERHRGLYAVKAQLLGKSALGSGGKAVGDIADLVFDFRTGRLAAIVIDTGGILPGAKRHAVSWSKARPIGGNGKHPLRLGLSKAAVDAAPVTTTMAPRPAATPSGHATVINRDRYGKPSGSSLPGPAERR